jgi:hypothetical protein
MNFVNANGGPGSAATTTANRVGAFPTPVSVPTSTSPPCVATENPGKDFVLYFLANSTPCQNLMDFINRSSALKSRIAFHEITPVLQQQPWFQRRQIVKVPALFDCQNPGNTRFGVEVNKFVELQHKLEIEMQNQRIVQAQNNRGFPPYAEINCKLDEVLQRVKTLEVDVAALRAGLPQQSSSKLYNTGVRIKTVERGAAPKQQPPFQPHVINNRSAQSSILLQKPSEIAEQQLAEQKGKMAGQPMTLQTVRIVKDDSKRNIDLQQIMEQRKQQFQSFKQKYNTNADGDDTNGDNVSDDDQPPNHENDFYNDQGDGFDNAETNTNDNKIDNEDF